MVCCVQVEQGRMETHHRRTLESFMLSGQLTKKRLVLAAGDVKIASRTQRWLVIYSGVISGASGVDIKGLSQGS